MAIIPLLPNEGRELIHKNMREARINGMSRDMALPQTYYWFYQKVRNHRPWDYKQQDRKLADFGNFNYGTAGFICSEHSRKNTLYGSWFRPIESQNLASVVGRMVWEISLWRRSTRPVLDKTRN